MPSFLRSTSLIWLLLIGSLWAQPRQSLVQLDVHPLAETWTYELGERADFAVRVSRNGHPLRNVSIRYEIGPECMPAVIRDSLALPEGETILTGLAGEEPGFVRCQVWVEVEGKTYQAWGTAGFAPDQLTPVIPQPKDFEAFWDSAKSDLARIPLEPHLTPLPEYSTDKVDAYHLRLNTLASPNWHGNYGHVYGILCVPKAPGLYPALLNVPGAGARPYYPDARANEGLITLTIGIHGIPVTLEEHVYTDLMRGAIMDYWTKGMEHRDTYYYKRVYLACVRAIDYLVSRPEFDGKALGVTGGSQGGALSIVTAGLDERVTHLAAFYPALCDLTGYLHGRAGGWPHMFSDYDPAVSPGWLTTAPYYDVVNFARRVTARGWYAWGYNDNVCPPTSMHAAYNVITAPKEFHPFYETAHWTYPEEQAAATAWLLESLRDVRP
ncbi:MAG: acetylxylan esterase [Bacteroidetes bacterium]|nr:MAG: acetylxylan esterase [Bacteroidota bacterium]